jgi:hypothetical protein
MRYSNKSGVRIWIFFFFPVLLNSLFIKVPGRSGKIPEPIDTLMRVSTASKIREASYFSSTQRKKPEDVWTRKGEKVGSACLLHPSVQDTVHTLIWHTQTHTQRAAKSLNTFSLRGCQWRKASQNRGRRECDGEGTCQCRTEFDGPQSI